MKTLSQLFTVYAITLLAACTNLTNLPDILKEQTKGSEHESYSIITLRDQVDETLITSKPEINYIKKGNEYVFTVSLPNIKDPNIQDYQWDIKWNYLIKKKAGQQTITGPGTIKLTPVDILSVSVEVTAINTKTGVKSKTLSNGLIIDLTKSKSTITKKK